MDPQPQSPQQLPPTQPTESSAVQQLPVTDPQLPPTQPKKSKKRLLIAVLVVIILIVIAFLGIYSSKNSNKTTSQNSSKASDCGTANCAESLKNASLTQVLDTIKADAPGNKLKISEDSKADKNSPAYGYVLNVSESGIERTFYGHTFNGVTLTYDLDTPNPKLANGKTDCSSVIPEIAYISTSIGKVFNSAGFDITEKGDFIGEVCPLSFTVVRGVDYCSVMFYVNPNLVQIGCIDNSKIAEHTKYATEIAAALRKSNLDVKLITENEIVASKTSGYEKTDQFVGVSDFILFYRKIGASEWTVVNTSASKDGSTCSYYNAEAKLAFKGDTCKDKNGASIVL